MLEAHETRHFAERLEDYVLVLNGLYTIAAGYQFAQEFKKAEAVWLEMLAIARDHKDRAREADYWVALGFQYLDMGNYQAALDMALRSKDLYAKLNDNRLALALNNIAQILTKMGCHDEALSWTKEALACCNPEWVVWWANFLLTNNIDYLISMTSAYPGRWRWGGRLTYLSGSVRHGQGAKTCTSWFAWWGTMR